MSHRSITEEDHYLFAEGTHQRLQEVLGAHPQADGGVVFRVWAPASPYVTVVGSFNNWHEESHPMTRISESGIWEARISEAKTGDLYKFCVHTPYGGFRLHKADPFARGAQLPPDTASIVCSSDHLWGDEQWMERRRTFEHTQEPMSIYELHLGSWVKPDQAENPSLQRTPEGEGTVPGDAEVPSGGEFIGYRALAPRLVEHIKKLGFTHVELMPMMEHPYYPSWGYQVTGFFAPTSRYGSIDDFKFFVDYLHQHDIGIILDWVPAHFPRDSHGLHWFDGTHLFEHPDWRRGYHPDWHTSIFDYDRPEVRSFLISSAFHWLEAFHIDGLRVDAVASMLYLDYSRQNGDWLPNQFGGRENLGAIKLLQDLNKSVRDQLPGVLMIAEESTAWPGVTGPVEHGGLGFHLKWDMGWMHDTLDYFSMDPVHRSHHQNSLTFRNIYAFSEQFCLPLSHDEVVHGKRAIFEKMPGDRWQKFANLRLLYASMFAQPGKKLLFMGAEIAAYHEWNPSTGLDWWLRQYEPHHGIEKLISRLNALYTGHSALHERDVSPEGFEWIDFTDSEQSVVSYLRKADGETILVVLNHTPVVRENYRVGVPGEGTYDVILNSDDREFGGSGTGTCQPLVSDRVSQHGREQSLLLTLPPLGALYLKLRNNTELAS